MAVVEGKPLKKLAEELGCSPFLVIDAGWNWLSVRIGKKRRVAAFCPGHSYETVERWIMKNIFEKEGLIKRKERDEREP